MTLYLSPRPKFDKNTKLDEKDKKDWTVKAAQSDLKNLSTTEHRITRLSVIVHLIRNLPATLENRRVSTIDHVRDIMRHLLAGDNLALCVCKTVTRSVWPTRFDN